LSPERIARFAFVLAGTAFCGQRPAEALKCYHRMQEAVPLGDLSGAEGWRTLMTADVAEAFLVAAGAFFALRPGRVIPR
jgi:hypothetical protein